MATIQETNDFEYSLGIQNSELKYNIVSMKIRDLLILFKKNKKHVVVGYPLTDYNYINNHIYLLLLNQGVAQDFIFSKSFNFVVGYHELKYLYAWMYKGIPLIRDEKKYYYKDFSESFRNNFESREVRVRFYEEHTNINSFLRRFYGYNFMFGDKTDIKEK